MVDAAALCIGWCVGKNGERAATTGAVQTADIDTRVWILDLDHGGELDFVLVEPHRARPDRRVISILSPFGEALFGARVGDVVHPRFLGREYSVLVRRVAPRGQKPEP